VTLLAIGGVASGWTATHRPSKPAYTSSAAAAAINEATSAIRSQPNYKLKPVPSGSKVLFFGDSYVNGGGTSGPDHAFFWKTAAQGGWIPVKFTTPGAGYFANGEGQGTFLQRLPLVQQRDVALVVLEGGINDQHGDVPTRQQGIDAVIKAAKKEFPRAQLVVVTPMDPSGRNTSQLLSQVISDELAIAYQNQVPSVSPYQEAWITPQNRAQYVAADNVHPNDVGAVYFGKRLYDDLKALGA
jgi:lysophospholipase L1-like esterase